MRRSSRLAKKKKVNYGEEHMWEKAVRKAEKDRSKLERTKGKRKALKKEPKKIRNHRNLYPYGMVPWYYNITH